MLLLIAGLAVMLVDNWQRLATGTSVLALVLPLSAFLSLPLVSTATSDTPVTLIRLFWFFLKVGSVLYGSGYVLLAFLQDDLVERWQWLTTNQLLDAIAIGQVTPGPVFTAATFIGYVLAGHAGALLATLGIFLPAFMLVAAVNPWVPTLRRSRWASGFLDGVNVASLGLMAVVTWKLAAAALLDWIAVGMALLSGIAVFRFQVNATWLVLGGSIIGLLVHMVA